MPRAGANARLSPGRPDFPRASILLRGRCEWFIEHLHLITLSSLDRQVRAKDFSRAPSDP